MLSRRTLTLVFFGVALILGITAGVAHRRLTLKGQGDFFTEWTQILTRPFLTAGQGAASEVRSITGVFRTNSRLKDENARLRKQIASLRSRVSTAEEGAAEAGRLRILLGMKPRIPYKVVAAPVLVRPATPWGETCTLGAGSARGVHPEAAVIAAGGLVGQVLTVTPGASQVLLIRDRRSSVACLTERTRAPGICSGQASELLKMEYIPMSAAVKKGDIVMTSGDGGLFPKGLPVGAIVSVTDDPQSHFKRALVRPAVQFRSLEEAFVVTGAP